jgi:hypothetical protein|tara:strand:- start:442 stop:885 length:444 start_codon:yes stop_codon:yes gene_type:complete
MAAFNPTKVMDSSEHVVVIVTIRNAGSAAGGTVVIDASTLVNHSADPVLYLEEVQWSINAAATGGVSLYYDASTDQEIVTMAPGNGYFGGDSFSALQLPANTGATGFNGDIGVAINKVDGFGGSGSEITVVNGTIIAKFAKISGYND